jgi:hypothetical protein
VVLGSHDLTKAKEPNRLEIKAQKSFPHPDYDTRTVANDIALIKLPKKIEFNGELNKLLLYYTLFTSQIKIPSNKIRNTFLVCINKSCFM